MGFFSCGLSVRLRHCTGVPYCFGLYCLSFVCYKVYGHKPVHAEHSKILSWFEHQCFIIGLYCHCKINSRFLLLNNKFYL